MAKKKTKRNTNNKQGNANRNYSRQNNNQSNTNQNNTKQSNSQNNKQSNRKQNDSIANKKVDNINNKSNNDNKNPKVKELEVNESKQSELKSVMNTMQKINADNKLSGKHNGKKPKATVNSADRENDNIQTNVTDNVENTSDALMDFSRIDDEHKGEIRKELTPKQRFFRICEKFGDLFLLNVFFTLTSIPVVTIGASFTAMYTVTIKMVRDEDVPIKNGYFKAFKRNFKQSTQIWIGLMVVFYLLYLQLKTVLATSAKSANFMVSLIGIQLILLTFLVPLLFPMIARYENTNFNMIKNAMLASFLHFGTWATVFFLWTIPVVLYYLRPTLFFYTWYLWLVFLAAFVAYTCSFRLRSMFDKIEEKPKLPIDENDENPESKSAQISE